MRILILNTDYLEFLNVFYMQHPFLEFASYDEQMSARNKSLFGTADFYSSNLRKLGHNAWDVHTNNQFLQRAWAGEHGIAFNAAHENTLKGDIISEHNVLRAAQASFAYLKRFLSLSRRPSAINQNWFYNTLSYQIKFYRPDILLNQNIYRISDSFLKRIKPDIKLLVGQHSGLCNFGDKDFSCYDLIISAFPPTLDYFRAKGIPAELNRLGFDPRVLAYLQPGPKDIDISFIGSLFNIHSSRIKWLEYLCERFPQMRVWGPGIGNLPVDSPIRKRYIGPAWGREMFQVLRNSKVTLNCHGDIPPYAANMRLYEATGVGAMLITDWKPNLHEMFEPGKEVIAYNTPEECARQIQYYLEHDDEREAIARSGQERTLREHTYYNRIKEFIDIIDKYMDNHRFV